MKRIIIYNLSKQIKNSYKIIFLIYFFKSNKINIEKKFRKYIFLNIFYLKIKKINQMKFYFNIKQQVVFSIIFGKSEAIIL